jgi:hypothetical protein
MEITGYKFQVEAAALNAKNSLRAFYLDVRPQGNPNGDGKPYVTTEVVEVQQGTFEGQSFYYFAGDFAPILGNPSVFNVDIDEI